MPLKKFHLVHDKKADNWRLEPEGGGRAKRVFESKAAATKGGVLADVLGADGGSVRIHTQDGRIEEERTFPSSADPKSSPG